MITHPLAILDTAILARVSEWQSAYQEATASVERKGKGQFFTPSAIAEFMAGLLPLANHEIRVLDPGAGAGVLSAAICDRILRHDQLHQVHFDLFETDGDVAPLLRKTAEACCRALSDAGHQMTYRIIRDDFVMSMAPNEGTLFSEQRDLYDLVITNPPYFKINKASCHAKAMSQIVHGQPNIYALFLAVSVSLLKPGGSMAAITPRSFCNGLYFREFRRWFLDRMSLDRAHLFHSRNDAFRETSVLQENLITLSTRSDAPSGATIVSSSSGRDFGAVQEQTLPTQEIVDPLDTDRIIYLPETAQDAEIVRIAQQWDHRFESHGLRVSTGPVVMFRATEFLLDGPGEGVPLLSAHNVGRLVTKWPVAKAKWPLAFVDDNASQKHLLPVKNYVLLKRFSAKEEKRRLTASCLLREDFPSSKVAIENHLNYIYHANRELTSAESLGIAAVFNSAFFDRYFRTFSGNTQVNATEVRRLHFPDIHSLERIGLRIGQTGTGSPSETEHVVLEELGVEGRLRRYLEAKAV